MNKLFKVVTSIAGVIILYLVVGSALIYVIWASCA